MAQNDTVVAVYAQHDAAEAAIRKVADSGRDKAARRAFAMALGSR